MPELPGSRLPSPAAPTRTARRARLAVAVTFGCHSATFGAFAARIPAIRDQLGLSLDDLGVALGGLAVGLLAGTRAVGWFEANHRTGVAVRVLLPVACLTLIGPAFATDLLSLTLLLALFGLVAGAVDVVMNVHAVAVERHYRRPIMSTFHGLWSVGGMLGSGLAAVAARYDVDVRVHFVAVAVVLAIASRWPLTGVLDASEERVGAPRTTPVGGPVDDALGRRNGQRNGQRNGRQSATWLVVLVLAAMGFGSFLIEGSVTDWSALFLQDERGASAGVAALGLTVFSAAMAISRLTGDRLGLALGPVALARVGALVALAGFGVLLLMPHDAAGLVGFGLIGLGVGPVVPIVFSAAGNTATARRPSVLGLAVSAGYVGGVVGPVVIGALADRFGLSIALTTPLAFLGLILAGAGLLRAAAGAYEPTAPHGLHG